MRNKAFIEVSRNKSQRMTIYHEMEHGILQKAFYPLQQELSREGLSASQYKVQAKMSGTG